MNKKRSFAAIFGVALFVLLLGFFSRLTMPKYISVSREGNFISEYYTEADRGNRHDVIFVGDCEAYSSIVPPLLWEKYGIKGFVRGSPSQTLAQSHALILDTLGYETPQAIVLSVYALCKEGTANEAYNRMTLDGMRLSSHKLRAVRESVGKGESVISYFIPLLRFHSRWSELEREDLKYLFWRPAVSHNGYYMQKGVVAGEVEHSYESDAPHRLPQENLMRLSEIVGDCKERGVELILFKAPISSWRYPWYEEWDAEISDFADEHSVAYYSLVREAENIGIDLSCDSYDGGLHLNVNGAEKTTLCFGNLLISNHKIYISRDRYAEEIWGEKVDKYYKEKNQ